MHQKIKRDEYGNLWCLYDLNGLPFRWVEIKPVPGEQARQVYNELKIRNKNGFCPMNALMQKWAKKKLPELSFRDLRKLRKYGETPRGYNIHHIVPRSLGGQADDLDNIVLIEPHAHTQLHKYFREDKLHVFLENFYADSVNADKKVFMSVPVLPPVVTAEEVPYVFKNAGKNAVFVKKNESYYDASMRVLRALWSKNYLLCKWLKEQKALEAEYISGHPDENDKRKMCHWIQKNAYLYRPAKNEGRCV